jgi:phenylpropionate dioxygenase-like ring-hydroxylating dioxygenase large terminal subunit
MPLQSPLPEPLLRSALASTLEAARTLPAEAYTSDEVFAWEAERFFEGGWVCVGRSDDLADPGDQRAYRVGRDGILVVRDARGRLQAFHNTCRHRGHELLSPGTARNLRVIKCPYHAWVYQLDGTLGAAPRFGDIEGFDKADYPLITARAHEWEGWIFLNADGAAPSFEETAGNLLELVAPWEPARLFVRASHEYEIAANWKTITENYHECYHCPSIHPALCVVTPVDSGENYEHDGLWVGGSMELKDFAETMSLTGASGGVPIRGLDARQRREVYYFGLFPNLLLSLHPDYVMTHRFEPLAPGRTKVECQWLFPPEAKERAGFTPDYASEFWDITNREDWLACESVYRGLQSRGFRQGPFAWSEDEVHMFMAMVARGYLDGSVSRPPRAHELDAAASAP